MTGPDHELLRILRSTTPAGLRAAFDHAPVMVTVTGGPDHRLVWRNRMAVELYGPAVNGRPLRELFPESAAVMDLWDRTYGGQFVEEQRRMVGPRDTGGRRRILRYSMAPLQHADGTTLGVIQFVCDETEEADAEREAAHGRLLATITDGLSRAPDPSAAVQALAAALVPEMADLAAVYAYPATDGPAVGTGRAIPPVALAVTAPLRRLGPPPAPGRRRRPSPWERALAAGTPLSIPIDATTMADIAPTPALREWVEAAGGRHLAVVPLIVAGRIAGGVLLMASDGRPGYDDVDLAFLQEVTTAAGAAIGEVRSREGYRQVAERLQRALLPAGPARVPGLTIASRYLPGGADQPVGGDWWDVLDLGGGRVGLGIGDISGHGIGAAALMGQARVAMRTAADARLSPAQVLSAVDARLGEAIEQQWDEDGSDMHRFATALYIVADLGSQSLVMASAGHLPLVLRTAEGPVQTVWAPPGPPLGLGLAGYEETEVRFGPGDTGLAFTDGLVEDRTCSVFDGIDHLVGLIRDGPPDATAEQLADLVLDRMGRLNGDNPDDIALLLFSVSGER